MRSDNLCVYAKEADLVTRKIELAIVEAVCVAKAEPGITTSKQQANAVANLVFSLRELADKLALLKEEPGIGHELDCVEKVTKELIDDEQLEYLSFRLVHGLEDLDPNWAKNKNGRFKKIEEIKKLLLKIC